MYTSKSILCDVVSNLVTLMESFQLNKWQTFPSKPGLSSFIPRHFHHLRASKGPTKLDVCHISVNVHNVQRKCDWKSFKLYVSYHEQLVSLWDHFRQAVTGSLQDNKDEEPHKSAVNYHTICAINNTDWIALECGMYSKWGGCMYTSTCDRHIMSYLH